MKRKKITRELKIGIFSLIVIGALYFTIQFLKGNDFFSGTNTYYAVYPNVSGLEPTSPVSVLGLTAGAIDKIQFDQKNRQMVVKIKLKKEFSLPKGTVAEIYSADILGGKAVQLLLGNEPGIHHAGDTLASSVQRDLTSMLTNEIGMLKDGISELLSNLDQAVLQLNQFLDHENRDSVKEILEHLNGSLKDINTFTNALSYNKGTVNRVVAGADTLLTELNQAAEQLSTTLAHFERISSQLKDTDITGIVDGLKELIDQLKDPEGSLGQLTSDPQLYHAVNGVLARADSLIRLISENPKKYLKITVF
ncbi:MAG: MCE family protein [Bacteroidales bacterium]|jgi:phospholipid/cholesterol/gamma-HCH transport system substrate-binding protein|nr:MlaD family protein [Bacteroidales bacterium]NLK80412.1 MCE family protein [Bacteroidales bacterium]HKM30972.1 MlaD family protein [Bacteroidales bacterium]